MDWHLLAGLPDAERRQVVAMMRRQRYAVGEVVFHEGDLADSVHFIAEGRVMVRRVTPAGDRAAFTVMGAGEAFGELAMLSAKSRRTSTVQALEATTTMALRFATFDRLRHQHPAVSALLVDLLAERVQRLSDHLLDALYAPVELRVVRRLADLCRTYETRPDAVARLPLTQSDLADMAGASRPATNRVLRRLETDEVVSLGRGQITVLDVVGLRRRC